MKQYILCSFICLLYASLWSSVAAFSIPLQSYSSLHPIKCIKYKYKEDTSHHLHRIHHTSTRYQHHHYASLLTRIKAGENDNSDGFESRRVDNDLGFDIVRGGSDDISDETWDDIEGSVPSKWMVMKNLLGINIFTYMLAALIIFFISMNVFVGPGWLGQFLGWDDVGTFTKTSDSLPLNVDVSGSEYLL